MLFRADLHVHTVLSPCASLEMSPDFIVRKAVENNIQLLGITDHNSLRQGRIVRDIASRYGISVFCGAEVTTREEVHCLVLFGQDDMADAFQTFLDERIPDIPNDERLFGDQVVVNEANEIIYTEKRSLLTAISSGIDETERYVHQLGGLFIPAHIDRPHFGIYGQLGFFPSDLCVDAIEISPKTDAIEFVGKHPELKNYPVVTGSDAHCPEDFGKVLTLLDLSELTFIMLKQYFQKKGSI